MLTHLLGRVAAQTVTAQSMQPPFMASAMDGYAVKFQDMVVGQVIDVIGEAPAGSPFEGVIHKGEAVHINTGGVVPEGADHVIINEDISRLKEKIVVRKTQQYPRNVRAAGVDFEKGKVLVRKGHVFNSLCLSVIAVANVDRVKCYKKPRVVIFSNGDELREPGTIIQNGDVINSNHFTLSALIKEWGGEPVYLGCAKDNVQAIKTMFLKAKDADIVVPVGGASVGEYDFVKKAFNELGGKIIFDKVAVRPGKPTWYGKLGKCLSLGLPGNPASAIVTGTLFLKPLIRELSGRSITPKYSKAIIMSTIPENGGREAYLRAQKTWNEDGKLCVTPWSNQDSSLLSPFLSCDSLIHRTPNAPALKLGSLVNVLTITSSTAMNG